MRQYKIETHVHTKESSGCGHVKAEDMIINYIQAEFDTIFITDHYHEHFFKFQSKGDTWEEKIDDVMNG